MFPDHGQLEERRFSRLHKAVFGLEGYELETEIVHATSNIDALDGKGRAPLIWALRRGDVTATRLLLKAGSNPNLVDGSGHLPLSYSASLACTRLLLSAGADIRLTNPRGTPLILYAYRCAPCEEYVNLLIAAGAPLHFRDCTGATPIHYAAIYGCLSMLKIVRQHGAEIDVLDDNGESPLNYAQNEEHDTQDVIEFLLAAGADYTRPNRFGWTILHYAARFGSMRLLNILKKTGIEHMNTRAVNQDGYTALQLAQRRVVAPDGFLEKLQVLLSDIRARNDQFNVTTLRTLDIHATEDDDPAEAFVDALESQV